MEIYSKFSSWAIWESNNPNGLFEKEQDMNEDIDFSKYIDQLQQTNYVILAMNPGGEFNEQSAKTATRKSTVNGRKWSNFHNIGKSRDYLLAEAIKRTKLHGSYMTDLFPIYGSASGDVKKFINNKANVNIINNLIKEFDEEMSCLLPNKSEIRLICLGTNVHYWAEKFLINNSDINNNYKAYYFPHYSAANGALVSADKNSPKYYPIVIRNKIEEYNLDL